MNPNIGKPANGDSKLCGLDVTSVQVLVSFLRFGSAATDDEVAVAAKSKSAFWREEAARHATATADTIARLLEREQPSQVRASAAGNPNCPAELLRQSAQDLDEDVRAAAAGNPACPEDLIRRLSADPSAEVRAWAAANPECPADVLATLVRDRKYAVRIFAEDNPRLPAESRKWLDALPNREYEADWAG